MNVTPIRIQYTSIAGENESVLSWQLARFQMSIWNFRNLDYYGAYIIV